MPTDTEFRALEDVVNALVRRMNTVLARLDALEGGYTRVSVTPPGPAPREGSGDAP